MSFILTFLLCRILDCEDLWQVIEHSRRITQFKLRKGSLYRENQEVRRLSKYDG
jgi:hypothetical protein